MAGGDYQVASSAALLGRTLANREFRVRTTTREQVPEARQPIRTNQQPGRSQCSGSDVGPATMRLRPLQASTSNFPSSSRIENGGQGHGPPQDYAAVPDALDLPFLPSAALQLHHALVPDDFSTTQALHSPPDRSEAPFRPTQSQTDHATPRDICFRPVDLHLDIAPIGKNDGAMLSLTHSHLDQLTTALASSPLIQLHVRRRWWDSPPSNTDAESERLLTPSLTHSSSVSDHGPEGTSPTKFTFEPPRAALPGSLYEPSTEKSSPPPPLPATTTTEVECGLVIADAEVQGAPIRYASQRYCRSDEPSRFGICSFLKISYGASDESELKVEQHGRKVELQIVSQLVDRKAGKKSHLLAVDVDLTERFVEAAFEEFANTLDIDVQTIRLTTETPSNIEDTLAVDAALVEATSLFSRLDRWTCTPQTRDLMSHIEDLRAQYRDFLVVQSSEYVHADGMTPTGIRVPWVSQHWHRTSSHTALGRSMRELRESIVTVVAKACNNGQWAKPYSTQVMTRAGELVEVECVPLFEGEATTSEAVVSRTWVCFVQLQREG